MSAPLAGLGVVDIGEGLMAPYAAKLLADLGATVYKIEPPGVGDAARLLGPFPRDGAPDPEASAAYLYVNTGKTGLTIDLDDARGRDLLRRLLGHANVVLASETEPALAARGLGYATLRDWCPDVILATVTGFGSEGPYADYQWTHLIGCAVGAWAGTCGFPDRPPLQAGGNVADFIGGSYGAVATLLAVEGRARHGGGDHVDVSGWESLITAALLPSLRYEFTGMLAGRQSDINTGPSFILPTKDGYIGVNVLTPAQWEMLCHFAGRSDLLEDPRFLEMTDRALHAAEIRAELVPAFADRTAEEIFHDAQTWRLPFGLVPDLVALPALEPNVARAFFATMDHPVAGRVSMPGLPFRFDGERDTPQPAPLLGQHNAAVLGGLLGIPDPERAALHAEGVV